MIVGVGELLWDVFPDGRRVAGGAPFNFAFHCHNLGHEAVVVSRVGDDELGLELRAEVRRLGLSDEFIQTDPTHPTGTVQVTVDTAGQPSYEIVQNVAWDHIGWTEEFQHLVRKCKAICFGTLAQRADTSRDTIQNALHTSLHEGAWVPLRVYDVNLREPYVQPGAVRASLAHAEWVKLNTDEAPRLAAILGREVGEPVEFVKRLICLTTPEQRCVLWTHGGSGCDVFGFQEDIHEPGVPAVVVDTVGAGDSFTAAMVCLHLEGRSLKDCAKFASHYAARVCEYRGGTPRIDRAEVERAAFG